MFKFLQNVFAQLWEQIVVKTPIPVPHTNPPNKPLSKVDALAQMMLSVNAPYESLYPPNTGTVINAQIHTISASAATVEANLIVNNSNKQNLDYVYLSACIFQESKFDAECFNHNLAEYNGVVSFEGTDWGMSQYSGYYLPDRTGMPIYPVQPKQPNEPINPTQAEAAQFENDMMAYKTAMTNYQHSVYHWENEASALARTAEWAVPEMAQIMHDNLDDATDYLPSILTIMEKLNTTALSHEQFFATLAYNRGVQGALEAIKTLNYSDMQHPFMVARWYTQFKAALETGIQPASHIMHAHEPFTSHVRR